jgi:hypothetical protein
LHTSIFIRFISKKLQSNVIKIDLSTKLQNTWQFGKVISPNEAPPESYYPGEVFRPEIG